MTYEDAFLEAIIEAPDDDTPRLIYADWLEENGRPARAEFIRTQIEAFSLPAGDPRRKEPEDRAEALRREHEREWLGPLRAWLLGWRFQRGLVERVAVNAQTLLKHVCTLFQLAPIRHAEIQRAEMFAGDLAKCPHMARLTSLRLHKLFTADALSLIGSPHLNNLTALDLRENGIGDTVVEALASSALLSRLVRLDLSCNSIHDAGAQALAESPQAGRLEWLNLGRNPIENVGAAALAGSRSLEKLRMLRLSGLRIGPWEKERLWRRFGEGVQYV
jgi:uncharacterized protein (TIGR02996 family)